MPKLLKTVLLISALLILSSTMLSAEESLTITTYYPSPYGIYRELRSQRLAVGENYIMHDTVCWEGDPVNCDGSISGQTMIPLTNNTDLIVEGSVGIGTTDTYGGLHIKKSGQALNLQTQNINDSFDIQFYDADDLSGAYKWDLTYRGNVGDGEVNGANALKLLSPGPSGTVMMWQYNTGNVGIGTAEPATKLHVSDTGKTLLTLEGSDTQSVRMNIKNNQSKQWMVGVGGSIGDANLPIDSFFIHEVGVATRLAINPSGNVGIGTTNPGDKLEVNGNITIKSSVNDLAFQVVDPTAPNEMRMFWHHSGFGELQAWNRSTGLTTPMQIWGSPLSLMGGNVGIGTVDPGADKLDVRGRAYASGGWATTNSDYAEWFEKEENAKQGDIIGLNLETGKVRRYRIGDKFIGIYSTNPAYVGNRFNETEEEMSKTHLLVALLGQLEFNKEQVRIEGRIIKSSDDKEIGILLSNGKAFIGR